MSKEDTIDKNIKNSKKETTLNKPFFKEINREKNDISIEKKNTIEIVSDKDYGKIFKLEKEVKNQKKSIILAKTVANQAMALLPKSMSFNKKDKLQNSIIPNMN